MHTQIQIRTKDALVFSYPLFSNKIKVIYLQIIHYTEIINFTLQVTVRQSYKSHHDFKGLFQIIVAGF